MSKAQERLDALQIELLGSEPSTTDVAEYANACINSACGIIKEKGGDLAVLWLLEEWKTRVEVKAGLKR